SAYVDYNYYDRLYQNNINFNSSDQFLTEDIDTLDPYSLVDAGVAYKWSMNNGNLMTFRGNVYNVLNNDYINQTDAFGFLNGNGTTWNFSLKYSF
ncbi:MAG: TonB-dependent receptor, partial [Bacteroidota bacterium]